MSARQTHTDAIPFEVQYAKKQTQNENSSRRRRNPSETLRMKSVVGFVDGQTTNPSLIAKNPEIQGLLASGHRLSSQEERDEYKKIVQSISPLVGEAGVSIEVFADIKYDSRGDARPGPGDVFLDSECLRQISVHSGGFASRGNVGAKRYSGQHDAVLFAGTSGCGICRNQGTQRTGVRIASIAICRQA